MKDFFMQFIHPHMRGQQVCSQFFEAESLEKAKEYADSQDYVGLLLLLEEREGSTCPNA